MATKIQVPDLETGRQMIEEVKREIKKTFAEMEGKTGDEWQRLCNRKYELNQKKKAIQNEMGRMVQQRRNQSGNHGLGTGSSAGNSHAA